jgi:hypothetical protein
LAAVSAASKTRSDSAVKADQQKRPLGAFVVYADVKIPTLAFDDLKPLKNKGY